MYKSLMPKTYSVRDVQREYRTIFDEAKKSGPVIILNNNKPDIAIVDIDYLENLRELASNAELEDAMDSISVYDREKKNGKLKRLSSLDDLDK